MNRLEILTEGPMVPIASLELGDTVELSATGYMTATVVAVDADTVTLFRPYVHTADFAHGDSKGGTYVCHYIGAETFRVCRDDSRPMRLVDRLAQPVA